MAEHYNVPHISIGSLLEEIQTWDQEKEDRWKKLLDDRDKKIKELTMQRELAKQEKKHAKEAAKKSVKNEDDEDGDEKPASAGASRPDTPEVPIKVQIDGDSDDEFKTIEIKEKVKEFIRKNGKDKRIPNEIINEAVRWRLERNDCQNRGYVLDGYPKNFMQAENVFVVTPKRPEKKFNEEGEEIPPDEEELARLTKPVL
jgi:adenylate kinase family enzyme